SWYTCEIRAMIASRDDRYIRSVIYNNECPQRDISRHSSHCCVFFDSENSSERNELVKIENFVRLIERAAKTIKNAAQFARVCLHDFERLPRVALMDHCVEPQLHREVELLFK